MQVDQEADVSSKIVLWICDLCAWLEDVDVSSSLQCISFGTVK